MRRFRPGLVILALILTLFPALCRAEGESILSLQEKEWTWEKNNIASFEGSASLASMPQGKLLLTLEIETEPKATDPGQVVFQTVNDQETEAGIHDHPRGFRRTDVHRQLENTGRRFLYKGGDYFPDLYGGREDRPGREEDDRRPHEGGDGGSG